MGDDEIKEDTMTPFSPSTLDTQKKTVTVPFWTDNPNILLNPTYLMEFFPSEDMSYSQKLNAITRMIIVLTVLMYLLTHTFRTILFGVLSIGVIYLVHFYYKEEKSKTDKKKDAFTG